MTQAEMRKEVAAKAALLGMREFMGLVQRRVLDQSMRGEEREFFLDKVLEYHARIQTMPKTYEQDGKGLEATVYLHYFTGSADWYITEKDSDPDGEGQVQAFGLADLFGDGGELGYISIKDILEAGAELDLYWEPKPLSVATRD